MNPLLIKLGVGLIVSAAAYVVILWKQNSKLQRPLYTPGNYTGSNIKNCPICLLELSQLMKNEVVTLTCKHKICIECCKKMFSYQVRGQRTCPNCRQLVDEETVARVKGEFQH